MIVKIHGSSDSSFNVIRVKSRSVHNVVATRIDIDFAITQQLKKLHKAKGSLVRLFVLLKEVPEFDPNVHECPECWRSDQPGRVYNNNDSTSGQYHDCGTCSRYR
jgi:hypothetical protein